jgi:hypothetical protein
MVAHDFIILESGHEHVRGTGYQREYEYSTGYLQSASQSVSQSVVSKPAKREGIILFRRTD